MPTLGADMTEGTVTRWLVKPGDQVKRGDIVVEVETDKADMEVEIFESGVISELLVPEGECVPVGTVLAIVGASPGVVPQAPAPAPPVTPPPAPERAEPRLVPPAPRQRATPTARVLAQQLGIDIATLDGTGIEGTITRQDVEHAARRATPTPAAVPAPGRTLLVSPRARRMARELGIDLATVAGTGPQGSITAGDLGAAPRPPEVPAPPATAAAPEKRGPRRGPIAALMERSNRDIPHYYLGLDINMEHTLDWLRAENKKRPVTERLLYSVLLLKATALAAHEVPEVNGYFSDGEFRPSSEVNVGVAISLREGGLVAPALLNAAEKPLSQLMAELQDLVKRARGGRLRASEMSSSSITVTNLGELGVDFVYGVIYPPQVALVGFGKIVERPWAENGMLGVKPVITTTLAADHRASDGHRGGMFLTTINRLLQEPEHL